MGATPPTGAATEGDRSGPGHMIRAATSETVTGMTQMGGERQVTLSGESVT